MARQALFEGLVYDEDDRLVETAVIGPDAHYVVDDQGFKRHIDSEQIDRQVLAFFLQQLDANKDIAVEQALKMMGKDDIFTKAALDSQIDNIDMDQIIAQGIPLQARNMMGMLGFRVIINYHGDLVKLDQPAVPDEDL
jgi:hypothetical protein